MRRSARCQVSNRIGPQRVFLRFTPGFFEMAGHEEGDFESLLVVEPGVYLGSIGAAQVGFRKPPGSSDALGYILSRQLDMEASQSRSESLVDVKGLVYL